ncbi:MAG: Holliday junction resolvase Hjc [Candidatus Diapherotrites archaeon]
MTRYEKGANAERELIKELYAKGYSVIRAAGSGVTPLPSPDLLALNGRKTLAFECKAWGSTSLTIPHEQFDSTMEWCAKADAEFFIAWKATGKGWHFLKPEHFHKNAKSYSVSFKDALAKGIPFSTLVK